MLKRLRLVLSVSLLGFGSLFLAGCGEDPVAYSINLEVWGVFDDSDAYTEAFKAYTERNPYVKGITYRKLSEQTYKEELIDAMASGRGPDIFMIRNTWVDTFTDKAVPAPSNLITEKEFRDAFVDVVVEDSIRDEGKIYAVPLSADSLALYYNKDLFNAAGISAPPTTWEEFITLATRLTEIDEFGNITQSGAAFGTAYNINRSTDVVMALAAQSGADFSANRIGGDSGMTKALEFYTQFARSGSSRYTWNPRLHYSIDAFYEGTLAMMANYSWHYQTIRQKNAKFNFAVAPLPQFAGSKPANFANYWTFAVAKNKTEPATTSARDKTSVPPGRYQEVRTREAWQLLKFLTFPHLGDKVTLYNVVSGTSKEFALPDDPAAGYLERTKKPAARRDLIERQKADVQLAPFSLGNLIARTWRPGNPEAVETILAEGIDAVNRGERTIGETLTVFKNRLNQFQNRR